jgi:hypothetical protein
VFGFVVGGMDTLDKMERISTDKNDRPKVSLVYSASSDVDEVIKEDIRIISTTVFKDPFAEQRQQEQSTPELEKQREDEVSNSKPLVDLLDHHLDRSDQLCRPALVSGSAIRWDHKDRPSKKEWESTCNPTKANQRDHVRTSTLGR